MSKSIVDWTEEFRPRALSQIIGNEYAVGQLKSWAESWKAGKPKKKGVILAGDPGIGKTSAAHALANDCEWDVVELNASDHRNEESVDRIVGHGSRSDAFSDDGSYRSASTGQLKLIIFDEADNLFGKEDRGGAKAIVHALKESAQPIILIVNDYYELTRRASGIKQLTQTIKFQRPTAQNIMEALQRIVSRLELDISTEVLQRIAKNAGGDIRAAVNDLHSLSLLKGKNLEETSGQLGWRDVPPEMMETLETIFTSNDPQKARLTLISLNETPDSFILWLDDNVPRAIRDGEARKRALDVVSRADIFLGRTRRRQYYGYWSYATDLMSMGICEISGDRVRIYSDTLRFFPDYLAKMGQTKSKRSAIESLVGKVALACHTSSKAAREAIVPYLRNLFSKDRDFAVALSRELELQAGEVALLLGVDSDSDEVVEILDAIDESGKEPRTESEPEEIEPEDDSKPAPSTAQSQRSLFEFR